MSLFISPTCTAITFNNGKIIGIQQTLHSPTSQIHYPHVAMGLSIIPVILKGWLCTLQKMETKMLNEGDTDYLLQK